MTPSLIAAPVPSPSVMSSATLSAGNPSLSPKSVTNLSISSPQPQPQPQLQPQSQPQPQPQSQPEPAAQSPLVDQTVAEPERVEVHHQPMDSQLIDGQPMDHQSGDHQPMDHQSGDHQPVDRPPMDHQPTLSQMEELPGPTEIIAPTVIVEPPSGEGDQ